MAELLSPATGSWNEEFIRSVFIPFDADAILKIPVCTCNTNDFSAWYPEKKGGFTVSSAYRFLIRTKMQREEWLEGRSGTSTRENEKAWTALSKMSMPSKIKKIPWRLARHSLPKPKHGPPGCVPPVWLPGFMQTCINIMHYGEVCVGTI